MTKDEIRNLITRGKLDKAIEAIINLSEKAGDSDTKDMAILMSGRYSSLERSERMGMISFSDANMERNRITQSTLALLSDLPDNAGGGGGGGSSTTTSAAGNSGGNAAPASGPKKMFISYAREDRKYVEALQTYLTPLVNKGLISTWSDSNITAGQAWSEAIEQNLRSSQVILYMVSADFLASGFIANYERKWANEEHQNNGTIIVPIIVRDCLWTGEDFAQFNAIPRHPGTSELTPMANWASQDQANLAVAKALEGILSK